MNKKNLRLLLAVLLVLACAAALLGWQWYSHRQDLPDGLARGNGRLEFTQVDVALKYPGRVTELLAREGDRVTVGQPLAREDQAEFLAQHAAARAQQAQAEAAIGRGEAELAARRAAARLASDELQHALTMRRQTLVSDMEVEQRRTAATAADAAVQGATKAVEEARHACEAAAAQVARVQTVLDDLTIHAPVAGRIEYRLAEPGTVLPGGGRLYTMLDPVDPYMTLFFPSAVAARLRVGDDARIMLDSLHGALPATVSFIAEEAQFTPKYVETTTERDQLVYRVKLRLTPDAQKRLGATLKAGMTGDGYVRTRADAAWPAALDQRTADRT